MKTGLLLFGTAGCHLCDEAERIMDEACGHRFEIIWRSVEIADDEELLRLYGASIPVVREVCGGGELHWPFAAEDVCRWVSALAHGAGNGGRAEDAEQVS
jgi:hypothetical protein